jgi:hypothetical protein
VNLRLSHSEPIIEKIRTIYVTRMCFPKRNVRTYKNKSTYFSDNCRSDVLFFLCSSSICTFSSIVNHFLFTDISSVNKRLHTKRPLGDHNGEWINCADTQVGLTLHERPTSQRRLTVFGKKVQFPPQLCLPSFIAKPETPIQEKQIVFTYCSVSFPPSAFVHGGFRKWEVTTC